VVDAVGISGAAVLCASVLAEALFRSRIHSGEVLIACTITAAMAPAMADSVKSMGATIRRLRGYRKAEGRAA
jgi:hypothetical protein